MLVLITYDVAAGSPNSRNRLRRISKACTDYGQRVQYSVFECDLNPAQWTKLRGRLISEIDPKSDSLRFYMLGANWHRKIEHVGAKPALDFDGPLIF